MLNRLFIVVGVLAILAIAAAFVVPRFIQWGDYRDRMQAIASEVFGAPVEIVGDIEFSLLPQPQLSFSDVKVGEAGAPVLSVAAVAAQFSLIDFLRDRYLVTRLVLERPVLRVRIDRTGAVDAGIALADRVTSADVSVARAQVVDGALTLNDERSGAVISIDDVDGELRMDALRGPFSFQGSGFYEGRGFTGRVATATFDAEGSSQVSLFLSPADEAFTLSAEGRLATAAAPSFTGTATYRQLPPVAPEGAETADIGRGDLILTSSIEATPARILLPEYSIVPDENRGATRLTGAAEIRLGAAQTFNAVISGGVLSLPPRDATAEQANAPYELVRLLSEIQVPPAPGLPGTIGVDIAEVNLRAVALRNVRFDARVDQGRWAIESFSASLPGNSRMTLAGTLTPAADGTDFAGTVSVTAGRLDGLAALWRRPPEGNPLFNVPGSFEGRLSLVGETLSIDDGVLSIADRTHRFEAEIGFEPATRHLNLTAELAELDARQSAALLAFLPEVARDRRFAATFPKGKFEISAEAANVGGIDGRKLVAAGFWEGGVLALDRLSAGDFGGASFDVGLTAFGSFAAPEFSGTGKVSIASADAPVLSALFDAIGTPAGWRGWLGRSLPAELELRLDPPSGEGGQGLAISGRAGAARLVLDAQLGVGIARALRGPIRLRLELRSDDPAALTAQLGLGNASLTPETGPMRAVAVVEGTAANSFETTVKIEGASGESLGFAGNVIASDLERLSGNGTLQVVMSDLSALIERLGAGGIWLPALQGSARVDFEGLERIRLTQIDARSGGEIVSGTLEWTRAADTAGVSGALAVGTIEARALLALLAGPAATLNSGSGYWPDGPAATGGMERMTTGRVAVRAATVTADGMPVMSGATFDLAWDATMARIRSFAASIGGGEMTAELAVCCAGPLPQMQLSGRLALVGVEFANIVPGPVAEAISANVDAAARFEATGDSLQAAFAAMTGEGSYTLHDVVIRGFDPAALGAITSFEEVLEMEPEAVTGRIVDQLDDTPFTAASVSGGFTIVGGVLRSPNLGIDAADARLFGSVNVRLADLGLSGGFVMSPTAPTGPGGVLSAANAAIAADLGGTLPAPLATYDVAGLVDAIMVRAFEIEVARLEELQAEDERRAREAAAERARLAAEDAARRAAEEEAARRAAEETQPPAEPDAPQGQPQLQPGFNLNLSPPPATF